MPRNTKIFEIAGGRYRVTQLGGTAGLRTALAVGHQLAPLLSAWDLHLRPGESLSLAALLQADAADLGPVLKSIGSLLAKLDADAIEELCITFGKVTEVYRAAGGGKPERWPQLVEADGKKTVLDAEFAGNVSGMLQWLVACAGWCCGSFLGDSGSTSDQDDSDVG